MILGRPRTIHPDDCDMTEPIECNIPPNPAITVPGSQQDLRDRDRPNTVSQNLFLYRLSNVWHTAKALKADKPYPEDYTIVRRLHDQINSILDLLPPTLRYESPDRSWDAEYSYLNQQREDLLTKANLMIMAIHRPHMEHHVESRRAALQAALVILESQNRSFSSIGPHHYKLFGLSFYTIDASLLLSLVAGKYSPHENTEFMARIDYTLQQAMDRLGVMYSYSPIARCGLAIIRQCYTVLKKRWEGNPATLALSIGNAIELENAGQRLAIAVSTDSLSEEQHHQQQQQRSLSSDPLSLFAQNSVPSVSTPSKPNRSRNSQALEARMDTESLAAISSDPALCLSPSTTYFDEAYWMNLISQTPDAPYFNLASADDMDEVFSTVNIGGG